MITKKKKNNNLKLNPASWMVKTAMSLIVNNNLKTVFKKNRIKN